MPNIPNIFRLKAAIQEYDWGKPGNSSLVAKYAPASVGKDYKVDENKCYAEIWMGTHPKGTASLWDEPQVSLRGLVMSSSGSYIGDRLVTSTQTHQAKFANSTEVPFLFKILSIGKALPLQAHPDKKLGESLNDADPAQFVDANHKPEIAVALNDGFRGFVGFREPQLIARDLQNVPEVRELINDDSLLEEFSKELDRGSLKLILTKLLQLDPNYVSHSIAKLVSRLERQGPSAIVGNEEVASSIKLLNNQYPGDIGVIVVPFFMNLISLNRGEAIYIGADEAHAYLEGNIVECMAVSDNVLNAAFVPPETRNLSTFLSALTYTSRSPSYYTLPASPYSRSEMGKTVAFDPPLEEFTVLWTRLTGSPSTGSGPSPISVQKRLNEEYEGKEVLCAVDGPTIGIVTMGKVSIEEQSAKRESVELEEGGIVFVKPGSGLVIQVIGEDNAEIWWSTCVE